MDDLDLENCEGCRQALTAAGYTFAAYGSGLPRPLNESITTVRVSPAQAVQRVAAEIDQRLKGRLAARLETNGDRVLVRTLVESPEQAAVARATVEDVARGVRQTLALDALDQGQNRISLRVE